MFYRAFLRPLAVLAIGVVACSVSSASADERQELKQRVFELQREANELLRSERPDEAHRLRQEAEELMQVLRQMDGEGLPDVRGPREARQAEQMAQLERMAQRMNHLREAAEHLKMAEMHDMAMEIIKRAELIERELAQAKERFARGQEGEQRRSENRRPPREVLERLEAEHRQHEVRTRAAMANRERMEAERRERAGHEEHGEHHGQAPWEEAMRDLRRENEQLRGEMRELREMMERIGGELKRQRNRD